MYSDRNLIDYLNLGFTFVITLCALYIAYVVYCNFDKQFDLRRLYYGSVQQLQDDFIKKGVGNMNYFKAIGLKVGPGKESE